MAGKRTFSFIIAPLLIAGFLLSISTCAQFQKQPALVIAGIEQTRNDNIEGYLGTLNIHGDPEEEYTKVGETGYTLIPIENAGTGDLIIEDMTVYRRIVNEEGVVTGAEASQSVFALVEETKPDFPVVIPPGETLSGIHAAFSPDTAGAASAALAVDTNAGPLYYKLSGTGMYELTLTASGTSGGRISEPLAVEIGQSVVYNAVTTEVELTAELTDPLGLSELLRWSLVSGTAVIDDPDTAEDESRLTKITVTLQDHSAIDAEFHNAYLFVAETGAGLNDGSSVADRTTLDNALGLYNTGSPDFHKGFVLSEGTYDLNTILSGNLNLPECSFRGGYSADFTARSFETETDRTVYPTIIETEAYSIVAGNDSTGVNPTGGPLTSESIIEGFIIREGTAGTAANNTPGLLIRSGATTEVRYNTITGPAEGYSLVARDASPDINNNVIYSGNPSSTNDAVAVHLDGSDALIEDNTIAPADGPLRSIGIHIFSESDPHITGNTITAGDSGDDGGESVGIYIDSFCSPVITGNTIYAGNSSGANGKSFGIYSINSCSPFISENIISGGTGAAISSALYFSYAGWPEIEDNLLSTAGGGNRYGVYIFTASTRIEHMIRNNLYDCPSGYVFLYMENRTITDMAEVNDRWVPDPEDETLWNYSSVP